MHASTNHIATQVKENLLSYSQHKFASNVVEKCLQYGTKEERGVLIQHLLYGHSEGWVLMLTVPLMRRIWVFVVAVAALRGSRCDCSRADAITW